MLAAGELSAGEADQLGTHVQNCDNCRELLSGYQETLSALRSGETQSGEIGSPSAAEWDQLMAGVREKVRPKVLAWPSWAKGGAVAVAGAILVVVSWQAGFLTDSKPGRVSDVARQDKSTARTGESSESDETYVAEPGTVELPRVTAAGEEDAPEGSAPYRQESREEDALTEDGSNLSLASLDTEISELDELVEGVGGTKDSDFLLFYLTEEEETELVKELESSTYIQESDEGRR